MFARLGLKTNGYWVLHREIDRDHLALGIDLIPECDEYSPQGQEYSRIAYETSVLYDRMLNAWSIGNNQKKEPSLGELVGAR